jgi:hypothetical protein
MYEFALNLWIIATSLVVITIAVSFLIPALFDLIERYNERT